MSSYGYSNDNKRESAQPRLSETSSSDSRPVEKMSQMTGVHDRMAQEVENLEKVICALREKLQPILNYEYVRASPTAEEKAPELVPLARSFNVFNHKINIVNEAIQDILLALEI